MPDETIKTMTAQEIADQARQQGRLEERVDAIRRDHTQLALSTDARFVRLEGQIADGFSQSQSDREAGNKSLGDLIKAHAAEVSAVVAQVNALTNKLSEGRGALNLGDKLLGAVLVIAASALGAWLSHQ